MALKKKPGEKSRNTKSKKPAATKNAATRKKAEQKLYVMEKNFRSLFKAVPVPIFAWRKIGDDFILIDFNDTAISFTHGAITSLVETKAKDMYCDNAEILKDFDQCFKSKSTVEHDMDYQFKTTGEQKYVHVKYAFVPPDLVMVHTDDFTERRLVETALRENEQDLRTLFETTSEGIALNEIIYDENGEMIDYRILNVNLAFYSMADYRGNNVVGNVATKLYGMSPENIRGFWKQHKEKNATAYAEMVNPHDNRRFLVATSPFVNDRFVTSFFDITERKQMEEALRESESRYKRLLDSVTDYIYTVQVKDDRAISTVHGLGCAGVTGYMPEDYEADPGLWYRMVFESDRARVTAQASRVLAGEDVSPLEHRIYHRDGSIRWVKNTCVPRHDQQRRLVAYDGLIQDITERKQAENALKESELKYRSLIESSSDAVFCVDEKGQFKFANHVYASNLGKTPDDFIGKTFRDFYPKEDADLRYEMTKRLFQTGESESFEGEIRLPNKTSYFHIRLNPIKDETGKVVLMLTSATDIAERKQAEEALKKSEEKYRKLVELTPNGLFIHAGGKIIFANSAAANILGSANPDDLIGKKLMDFVHPDYRGLVAERVRQIIENKDSAPLIEEKYVRLDGSVIDAEVAAIPFSSDEGNAVQVVFRDITKHKKAEDEISKLTASLEQRVEERTQELRDAQEQLVRKEKLAVLGQLAGSVGHELRNPLGVIANAVYFLKMAQPDANEKIKEYLNLIEKHIRISDMIITDLLEFTRIKSADLKPVSMPELIQQTLERFPPPEEVQVTLDLSADMPQVHADPQHIIQVLGNLTLNACQAMPCGGKLTISSHIQDNMVCISVQDTGTGIPPENMKKLFEPLFTTKPKGIGLGLAVSKKLIEANGGRIEVESEPGKGSIFTLVLPIKKEIAAV